MIHYTLDEIKNLCRFLKRNMNEAIVIGAAMLFISLDRYNPIWNAWFSTFFYYAVLPVLTIVFLLRKNPLQLGLGWGEPKIWWRHVAIVCMIAAPVLFAFSRSAGLRAYYFQQDFDVLIYSLTTLASLFASEFFFRGFLIFGLKDKLKEASIFVQVIPFVMVHIGKPEIETLSTILTGILFGYIAYKGRSFWPVFIIHMFINIFFVFSINLL